MTQWDYGRALPPELWHLLENCEAAGQCQSPVNIRAAASVTNARLGSIVPKYTPVSLEAFFSTHLHLEVEVEADAGEVESRGVFLPLRQFHVHARAEHVVNGRLAKMATHLVHSDGKRNFLLGVFVEQGDTDHPCVKLLVERLPHLLHKPEGLNLWSDGIPEVNPEDALPEVWSYFVYQGSLTTPQCNESTSFFLFASPIHTFHSNTGFRRICSRRKQPPRPASERSCRRVLCTALIQQVRLRMPVCKIAASSV